MKNNFFKLLFGTLAMTLGFSSCIVDDCYYVTDYWGDTYYVCLQEASDVDEFYEHLDELQEEGYKVEKKK